MSRLEPPAVHLMASADDVEAQFYEALRDGDVDKLMSLWSDDDEVFVVHPGGSRVIGTRAIRATFEAMFANGGRIAAVPERVRRLRTMDAAVHHLVERIAIVTPEGPRTGYVMVTNVYLKTAQGWRIAAHHASPGSMDEVAEVSDVPSVLH